MSRPSWEDVQRESLHCPMLQAAVHQADAGHCSREDALIAAALTLSRERQRLFDRELERLRFTPARLLKALVT
jgi:hypothetical protein